MISLPQEDFYYLGSAFRYIFLPVQLPTSAAFTRVAPVTFWLIGSPGKVRWGRVRPTACYDICVAFFLILLCEYVAHYS